MTPRLVGLVWEAADPVLVARFWAELLGRELVSDGDGVSVPGSETQVDLRFVPGAVAASGPNRIHLHLTSATPDDQQATVARVLQLGGRPLDVGQQPGEGHIVLADPEGNALCVIEAGNAYLEGCGPLGELACDGSRDVGVFWSRALEWPLVWDQDEETAIQSPRGGTKIAWGGPPHAPLDQGRRQRLLLSLDGLERDAEIDRLVALGAIDRGTEAGVTRLSDPDGNEFLLASLGRTSV